MDFGALAVALVLSLSAGAAVYAYWRTHGVDALRAEVSQLRHDVQATVAQLHVELEKYARDSAHSHDEQRREYKRLADEVEEMYERTARERARLDGRRGGGRPKEEAPPAPAMTRDDYLAHLGRGGAPSAEIERALGL